MSDKKNSKDKEENKGILGGIFDHLTGHSKDKKDDKKPSAKSVHKAKGQHTNSKGKDTEEAPKNEVKPVKPKTQEPRNEMGSVLPMSDSEKKALDKKHAQEEKEIQKRKEEADEEKAAKAKEATKKTEKLVKEKEKLDEKIKDLVDPYYVDHPGFVSGNPATAVPPVPKENEHLQSKDNPGAPQVPFPGLGSGGTYQVGDELPGSNPGKYEPPPPGTTLG